MSKEPEDFVSLLLVSYTQAASSLSNMLCSESFLLRIIKGI